MHQSFVASQAPFHITWNGEAVTIDSEPESPLSAVVDVATRSEGVDQVTSGTATFLESALGANLAKLQAARTLTRKGVEFVICGVTPPAGGVVIVNITRTDSEFTTVSALD